MRRPPRLWPLDQSMRLAATEDGRFGRGVPPGPRGQQSILTGSLQAHRVWLAIGGTRSAGGVFCRHRLACVGRRPRLCNSPAEAEANYRPGWGNCSFRRACCVPGPDARDIPSWLLCMAGNAKIPDAPQHRRAMCRVTVVAVNPMHA